jgi:putative two-component system response regulator
MKHRLTNASSASTEFFERAIQALHQFKGLGNAELRLACLFDACQFFYVVNQPFLGIAPAKEAISLARAIADKALLRRGLNTLGIVFADTGNCSGAIECYAEALELAQQLDDSDAETAVWLNLGAALLYMAQYREAIACFERTISICGNDPKLDAQRQKAHANIALCSIHTEDFGRGLKAAEASISTALPPTTAGEKLSRVLREYTYTRLLLEVDNLERARERCDIARRYAQESGSPRAEICASIAEGLYEIHAGKTDVGLSRLTSMLERARLMSSTHRDALIAMVKAYEILGQPERALIYLRELLDQTRRQQQEYALKHLKLQLKSGGSDSGGYAAATNLERREAALRGKVAEQELFRSRIEMLERLAVTAELRDDSTGEHSYRVGKLSSLIASEYGCDDGTCFMVELAARLHDIGKIGVPDAILLKPDKLNDAERQIMRTHTTVGAELLSKSNIPHMQMAEEIARHHHEWWNGEGYPGNLSGSAIPLASRITALADVFDALTHKRPYKEAWPIEKALEEIRQLKGTQFDPELTDLFLVLISKLRLEHGELDAYLGQAAMSSPFLQARSRIWDTLRKSKDVDGTGADSRLDLQR